MKPIITLLTALFCLTVPSLHAAELQTLPLEYHYEDFGVPQFDSLKNEFDFEDSIAAGTTEMEKQSLLLNWVFQTLKYGDNGDDATMINGLEILRLSAQGGASSAINHAAVFVQCALSQGWTARMVGVRGMRGEHNLADIWSNQYQKWYLADPLYNMHFLKDGVPLDISELRTEWLKDTCDAVTYVFSTGAAEERYTNADFPVTKLVYPAWRLAPLDQDYISMCNAIHVFGRNDYWTSGAGVYTNPIYCINDETNGWQTSWVFRDRTDIDNMKVLFHDVNRAAVTMTATGGNSFSVALDPRGDFNYTPYLREVQVKIDADAWAVSDSVFTWNLNTGDNTLSVKTVNDYGVEGGVTTMRFTVPDVAGPVISDVRWEADINTLARITWRTDEFTTGSIEYGDDAGYGNVQAGSDVLDTVHWAYLDSLNIIGKPHFRIVAEDIFGNRTAGDDNVILPDTVIPVISGVMTSMVRNRSANFVWYTSIGTDAQVEYGTTDSYGSLSNLYEEDWMKHTVRVTGLEPGTWYHYRVISKDPFGNTAVSGDTAFKTDGTSVIADAESFREAYHAYGTNPVREQFEFFYTLDGPSTVQAGMYTAGGALVALMADGTQGAGVRQLVFDRSENRGGVYMFRMVINNIVYVQRVVFLK